MSRFVDSMMPRLCVVLVISLGLVDSFLFSARDAKAFPREPLMFYGESLKAWCNLTATGSRKADDITLGMRLENSDTVEKAIAESDLERAGENVFSWVPINETYFTTSVNHLLCFDQERYIEGTIIFVERPLQNVMNVTTTSNGSDMTVAWTDGVDYLTWNRVHTNVQWSNTRLGARHGYPCEALDDTNSCRVNPPPSGAIYIRFNVTISMEQRPAPESVENVQRVWTSLEVKVDLQSGTITKIEQRSA